MNLLPSMLRLLMGLSKPRIIVNFKKQLKTQFLRVNRNLILAYNSFFSLFNEWQISKLSK